MRLWVLAAVAVMIGALALPAYAGAGVNNLEQCRNGAPGSPVTCTGNAWVTGNAGSTNSHYTEGDSVPFRYAMTGLGLGAHTFDIGYDFTQNGKHAYDYLTTFNRTEPTADACGGLPVGFGVCVPGAPGAIPVDTSLAAAVPPVSQIPGEIRIWNGVITDVAFLNTPLSGPEGSAIPRIVRVTFTATSPNVVLAWGGHIGTQADWGVGDSAGAIPGSPYHMRNEGIDGSGGNKERSLSVIEPALPTVTVIKTVQGAAPGDTTAFPMTLTGQNAFSLADGASRMFTVAPGAFILAEGAPPAGYAHVSTACVTADNTPIGATGPGAREYGFTAPPAADITCTVTNRRQPTITVTKRVLGVDGDTTAFPMTLTGQTDFSLTDDQTTTFVVDPGTFTLTEGTIPADYGFAGIACTLSGVQTPVGNDHGTRAATFDLTAGQTADCTVTNGLLPTIRVVKNVVGGQNDPTTFPIALMRDDAVMGQGALADDQTLGPITVDPGKYALTEGTLPDGYGFLGIACTNEAVNAPGTQSAEVPVGFGDDVTCTVTNTRHPKLIVNKTVLGTQAADAPFGFALNGTAVAPAVLDDTFTLTNGGSRTIVLDPKATYTLNETTMPAGYGFVSVACEVAPNTDGPRLSTITLSATNPLVDLGAADAGDVITCTYTNQKLPTIQVTKTLTGDGAAGDTTGFGFILDNQPFATLANGQSSAATAVSVGQHTITEGALPANNADGSGYRFDAAACTLNGQPIGAASGQGVSLDLPAGAQVICTFTNTRLPAPVIVGAPAPTPTPRVNQRRPVIAITKTAPARAVGLQRFVYTIRVRNRGRVAARNVTVTDPLPAGLTFLRSSRRATLRGGTLTIKLGTLAPGRSRIVKLTVRAAADISGRRTNTATAAATGAPTVRAKATTVFRKLVTQAPPPVTG